MALHGWLPLQGRFATGAVGLSILLLAATPSVSGESGDVALLGGSGTSIVAERDGLALTELEWSIWQNNEPTDSHLKVWVNVTNEGPQPAVDLTAEMRGAETALVFSADTFSMTGNVGRGGSASHAFALMPRTTATVSAQLTSTNFLGVLGLEVASPTGEVFQAQLAGNGASVAIPLGDVNEGVFGEWTAVVSHEGGPRGFSYSVIVSQDFADTAENLTLAELPAGETYHFYYNIWADEPYPTLPPNLTITVNGTVSPEAGGRRVSYVVRAEGPAVEIPTEKAGGGGADSTGMLLGAAAVTAVAGAVVVVFRARPTWLRGIAGLRRGKES